MSARRLEPMRRRSTRARRRYRWRRREWRAAVADSLYVLNGVLAPHEVRRSRFPLFRFAAGAVRYMDGL